MQTQLKSVKCSNVEDSQRYTPEVNMDFFTMGMFIIDEIVYNDQKRLDNIIGGAGIYAAQSAGLFLDRPHRAKSAMIMDAGNDFPLDMRQTIDSWGLGIIWRSRPDRLTTRGLNTYLANEERDFKYVTPKIQINSEDILERSQIIATKSLHLICNPRRCFEICAAVGGDRGILFIWEPVPFNVSPEDWNDCRKMFSFAHVISPNAKEAASFLGRPEPRTKEEIQLVADAFHEYKGILVIRCGAMGSLLKYRGKKHWFRAYHLSSEFVVDPTGGGNSFLGGLSIGLVQSPDNIQTALVYATVAAGIQIEQVGLAKYDAELDRWNGSKVAERVDYYMQREGLIGKTII